MRAQPSTATRAQRAAAMLGATVLRLLFATLRLRVLDPDGCFRGLPGSPVIFVFWHNRILAMTAAFRRIYPRERGGVLVLTSASRDGAWLGEMVRQFGMGSVRGSSSRRGATAMRELLDRVAQGYDIAITPDGPRGPCYKLGPGPVYLAQKAGLSVIPVHAQFGSVWQLRTWDHFNIPRPFTKLTVLFGPPVKVAPEMNGEEFERARLELETLLREGTC
jgi:lysophospholipid acyltransferase (LPLAT)-like uncharacterized protein